MLTSWWYSKIGHTFSLVCGLLALGTGASAQVNVTTQHGDNSRTGANLQETILTPSNVNVSSFGKLFSVAVDGQIYAQPLYVSRVAVPGQGTHNVVYVATMNNSLYALDADTGTKLWQKTFGTPVTPADIENASNITRGSHVGILGTPVIDLSTSTIYFVSRNETVSGSTKTFTQSLNALDITSGSPKFGSPKRITGTYTSADGTLTFDPKIQNQRPALTLANGNVYIAWASHDDLGSYHGWVMAYKASDLSQVATYSNTTSGSRGGIWQAGQGLTVDVNGNLLLSSGNGSFGASTNGVTQTGNSFAKLSPTLGLLDYFTPSNSASLNAGDQDLGASGLLGIPGTTLVVGGGKQGVLYVVDTRGMGHFNSSQDQIAQEWQAVTGKGSSHIHGTPIYFNSAVNGPTVYVWGENDYLKSFTFNTSSLFNTTPLHKSTMTAPVTNANSAMPGGFLSVTANGGSKGIVWASTPYNGNAQQKTVQGILHAFDADTLTELWNDKQNSARDEVGNFAKYVPPTVASGKLYAASFGPLGSADGSGTLNVYGLLSGGGSQTIANGTYKIISRSSGLALDAASRGTANGTAIGQYTYGGASNQRWTVTYLGSSLYSLVNVNAVKALDVTGGSGGSGTWVELWASNNGSNQKWTITATSGGYYKVSPSYNSGLALDVYGAYTGNYAAGSGSNSGRIEVYTSTGGSNQQWAFQTP